MELDISGKMIVSSPRSCIIEPWTRIQKSASCTVPGACGEYCHALYPGIADSMVMIVTNAVIVGFHCVLFVLVMILLSQAYVDARYIE